MKPRLVGDKDRLILHEDVTRLLAFLDKAAKTGQPTPDYVARKRKELGPDILGRKSSWPEFWSQSRMVIRLLLQSGLRCRELARLQVRDCDIRSRPHRLLVRAGKKRRADEVDEVLIPSALAAELETWIAEHALEPSDPVISNRRGTQCNRRWIYELAKAPMRQIGLNPKFATHHCRHRFATSLMQQTDGDLLFVQKQLRHRSLQPTSAYLHMADFEGATMEAVDRMGLDQAPAPGRYKKRSKHRNLAIQMQLEEDRRGHRRR